MDVIPTKCTYIGPRVRNPGTLTARPAPMVTLSGTYCPVNVAYVDAVRLPSAVTVDNEDTFVGPRQRRM